MAVTKLSADAPPFLFSTSHHQFPTPPPPHCMPLSPYHLATCSPPFLVVHNYLLPAFPFPAVRSIYGFPPLPHPPAPVLFPGKVVHSPPTKLPAGTGAILCKADPSPPPATPTATPPAAPPAPLSSTDASSPPPPTKAAPSQRKALPHGCPPHRLMLFMGGGVAAEKLQTPAAEPMAPRAAEPVKPEREPAPAPATAPRPRGRMATPPLERGKQQATERGKVVGPRQAKVPVERPSLAFTTRPPSPVPQPEWRKRPVTSVMIRNIPNKLTPGELMQLLDEHCGRVNKKKKHAAYDFLYLPMDFSKCANMGYAFVNLTTAAAARGLHYALHGARWKVHGTKKVIDIRSARIQGKDALVTHFSGSTFPCHTDDYLPTVFSPPRDGATGPSSPMYVGNRVDIPAPPARQPLPVAPAPQRQEWRCVGGDVEAKLAPSS